MVKVTMNLVDYEFSSDEERAEAPEKREIQHGDSAEGGNKCTENKKNEERSRDNSSSKEGNHGLGGNETDNVCAKKKAHIHLAQKWDAGRENASMGDKTHDSDVMRNDGIAEGNEAPSEAPLLSKLKDAENMSHYDGGGDDDNGDDCVDGHGTEVRPGEQHRKEQNKQRSAPLVSEQKDNPIAKGANLLESNNLINISVNENNFDDLFFLPPNEYSDCLNQKIEELSKLYELNLTINKNIINSNEYKNPCILEKIMQIFQIDVYSSNYPLSIYNPHDFLSIDLFNEKGEETDQKKTKTKWSNH
ncbi:HCNGP-like protein [Plasmodium cynomolgi strain B]|uniref:HCNGP-like protein n=1 Tax=Plasmodium cynomolgi (strain B) TaxID=1120755 RepID=K6UKS0_PLACD|nr:HCNGP-like protein [Plasmodium cynomolgi strain B]GAB67058.1 HCNGP-like protein [Plasmodium cynomolgi strain B]